MKTSAAQVKSKGMISQQAWVVFQVILGSIFIGLMAQVSIPLPFTPVPMTLQTLAVALLAITLGSRKAPLAVVAYLTQATFGLPVLAGGMANPLWLLGAKAGYLIGFIFSAYVVSKILETMKQPTFLKTWLALSLNEGITLTLGSLWLSLFVGLENAFFLGVLPFLPGAAAKITVAATAVKPVAWIKSKF